MTRSDPIVPRTCLWSASNEMATLHANMLMLSPLVELLLNETVVSEAWHSVPGVVHDRGM